MIHYQGTAIPNLAMLNAEQRIAAQIPEAMLDLTTALLIGDIMEKFGVGRTKAGEGVRTARVWRGMRRRLGNVGQ